MSLSWKSEQKLRLEKLVDESHPTILELLNDPHILSVIDFQSNRHKKLENYVLAHLKDVIDVAIGRTENVDSEIQKKAAQLLTRYNRPNFIASRLSISGELFNYLSMSFEKEYNFLPALQLFQQIILETDANILGLIKEPVALFKRLLKLLPSAPIHAFLLELMSPQHNLESVKKWMVQVEADVWLMPFLQYEESKLLAGLSILCALVEILDPKSEPMKRLASSETIKNIFDTGINSPTNDVAYGAFQLLVSICNRCDDSKDSGQLEGIVEFFKSQTHNLCQYIKSDEIFSRDKKAACELLITVIKTSDLTPELIDFITYLFEKFFKFPYNSFLHLVILSIFDDFAEKEEAFSEFIKKNKVAEKFMEIEQKREELMASYWGPCTSIEKILKDKVKDNEEWTKFVETTLNPRLEILEKQYGGEVPKIKVFMSSDSDMEHIKRIDSADLLGILHGLDDHEEDVFVSLSGSEEEDSNEDEEKEEHIDNK